MVPNVNEVFNAMAISSHRKQHLFTIDAMYIGHVCSTRTLMKRQGAICEFLTSNREMSAEKLLYANTLGKHRSVIIVVLRIHHSYFFFLTWRMLYP